MPFAYRWCIGLAGAVVLAVFWSGCAIDRGTEPAATRDDVPLTAKLPAMNVFDDPIVAISDPIPAGRLRSDHFPVQYVVHLPETPPNGIARVDDIVIQYGGNWVCTETSIYHPRDSVWIPVDTLFGIFDECEYYSLSWSNTQYTSVFGLTYDDIVRHGNGELRIAGSHFEAVNVLLVQYRDDYTARPVGQRSKEWATAMTVVGDEIWIATESHFPPVPSNPIRIYDSTGCLLRSFDLGRGRVNGLGYHDGTIWAVVGPGWTFLQLTPDGEVTDEFLARPYMCGSDLPPDCATSLVPLASGLGRLWAVGAGQLWGYQPDSSLAVDSGVVDWRFPLRYSIPMSIACDGAYFYTISTCELGITCRNSIGVVNLSSETVYWGYPPIKRVRWIAWDGEAMWSVHYGPIDGLSGFGPLLLSRFKIPRFDPPAGE